MLRSLVLACAALLAARAAAHDDDQHKPAAPAHQHDAAAQEKAFGRPGDPARVDRTVVIEMRDPVEFAPAQIAVKTGETIRFVVVNAGKHLHEMVLGTREELAEHQAMMKRQKDMHHDEPSMAHVAPGKSGVIVWQFTRPGEFFYACLVEDHYDLGMYGRITVIGAPVAEHEAHAMHEMQG